MLVIDVMAMVMDIVLKKEALMHVIDVMVSLMEVMDIVIGWKL